MSGKPSLADGTPIDLPRLLETRLLVQANSGGGKSYALRRLLEQTANSVQQLVIDPEGEFATLRERFDYVVCAPRDGDAVAHPRTAKLLARRLLETGVSAIIDIYDLKADERKSFVRQFCETLVDAPKSLWHPALIVLDEAHVFAPETGSAESLGPVIDLATRGRKRGFCLVAATQRLAKLHKDAAAEMNNKMIGRTGLDVDVKRAADELGMTKQEAMQALKFLDEGEWYVFGPALSRSITKIKVGPVVTTHPKAGQRLLTAPPEPSAKVRKVLAELADLPQQAQDEARTLEDFKRQLAEANRKLRTAAAKPVLTKSSSNEEPKTNTTEIRQLRARIAALERDNEALQKYSHGVFNAAALVQAELEDARLLAHDVKVRLGKAAGVVFPKQPKIAPAMSAPPAQNAPRNIPVSIPPVANSDTGLKKGERMMLNAIAQFGDDGVDREQLFVLTGYKSTSIDTYLKRLRGAGHIGRDWPVVATPEGIAALGDAFEPLPRGAELVAFWAERLGEGENKLLRVIIESEPNGLTKAEVGALTNYKETSVDTYAKRLRARRIIEKRDGRWYAHANLL